jgi:hypothetical protein
MCHIKVIFTFLAKVSVPFLMYIFRDSKHLTVFLNLLLTSQGMSFLGCLKPINGCCTVPLF